MSRWGALAILMTLAFLNYMDRNLVFPLLRLIAADLHLEVQELGALATGFHIVYACSAPLAGRLADGMSRKVILLVSLTVWSIVTALSGTATGFLSLLVWRSLTGLGEGGYFPTAISLIGDLFGPRERGMAIALHGVCTTLGGSAGYAVAGIIGDRWGWRAPFLLAILPGLTLAVVLAFGLREPARGATTAPPPARTADSADAADGAAGTPYRPSPGGGAAHRKRSYWAIVLSPTVLLIAFCSCAASFSMNGLNTFMPLYLSSVRGVSTQAAGVYTGVFFGATLLGQLGGGFLSDRLATRVPGARPLLVALPYLLVFPAAIAIAHVNVVLVALIAYGATQIGRGFAEPNIYGTVLDAVAPDERGSAQGFLLLLTFVGAALAPYLGGEVIAKLGYTPAFHLLAGAAGVAALLAGGLCVVLRRR